MACYIQAAFWHLHNGNKAVKKVRNISWVIFVISILAACFLSFTFTTFPPSSTGDPESSLLIVWLPLITAIVSLISAVTTSIVTLRRDRLETRKAELDLAKTQLELAKLQKDTELEIAKVQRELDELKKSEQEEGDISSD